MSELSIKEIRKRIAESVSEYYYACIRPDMGNIRCYSTCPFIDRCWIEEDANSKSE